MDGDLSDLKVTELRALCEEHELDTKGVKSVLVARLEEFRASQSAVPPKEPTPLKPIPAPAVAAEAAAPQKYSLLNINASVDDMDEEHDEELQPASFEDASSDASSSADASPASSSVPPLDSLTKYPNHFTGLLYQLGQISPPPPLSFTSPSLDAQSTPPSSRFLSALSRISGSTSPDMKSLGPKGPSSADAGRDRKYNPLHPSYYPMPGDTSLTDVDAWSALLTEASLSRAGSHVSLLTCYVALLKCFPYSAPHWVLVIETLTSRISTGHFSTHLQPAGGPAGSQHLTFCVDQCFLVLLGAHRTDLHPRPYIPPSLYPLPLPASLTSAVGPSALLASSPAALLYAAVLAAPLAPAVYNLWPAYIKWVKDTTRRQEAAGEMSASDAATRLLAAYQIAVNTMDVGEGAGTMWREFAEYIKGLNDPKGDGSEKNKAPVIDKKRLAAKLREVYHKALETPLPNLSELWEQYTAFERGEAADGGPSARQAVETLLAERESRMQASKQVYAERTINSVSLSLGRLAQNPPPINAAGSSAAEDINDPKKLLGRWRRRLAFERSNPERLSAPEASVRIRSCFKAAVGVLTGHPELWHEWAMWEAYGAFGSASFHGQGGNKQAASKSAGAERLPAGGGACAVFALAECVLPDSALLAGAFADYSESVGDVGEYPQAGSSDPSAKPGGALGVLDRYVTRWPCSVGFVLLERFVRRNFGMMEARRVFHRARVTLKTRGEDDVEHLDAGDDASGGVDGGDGSKALAKVANSGVVVNKFAQVKADTSNAGGDDDSFVGFMTWHVYLNHASLELRSNGLPDVAARVFELGIARHRSFLTSPKYVMAYAELLLEKGDEDNFRSLIERALVACGEKYGQEDKGADGVSSSVILAQRPLWDLLLKFESSLSRDSGDPTRVRQVEVRRRVALGEEAEGGIPKILQEQLVRSDGANAGSVSGGLGRLLDRYSLTGIMGSEAEASGAVGGGGSDASFAARHVVLSAAAVSAQAQSQAMLGGAADRSKAARERAAERDALARVYGPPWIQPLLDLLPPRRAGARPPPAVTEFALNSLRNYQLPPRPVEEGPKRLGLLGNDTRGGGGGGGGGGGEKRGRSNDDSDEDDDGGGANDGMFAKRQRQKVVGGA